jgi:hypothetical protein
VCVPGAWHDSLAMNVDGTTRRQEAPGPAVAFLLVVGMLTRSVGSGAIVPRPLGLAAGLLVGAFGAFGLACGAWAAVRRLRAWVATGPACLSRAMIGVYLWTGFVLGLLAILVAAGGDYSHLGTLPR